MLHIDFSNRINNIDKFHSYDLYNKIKYSLLVITMLNIDNIYIEERTLSEGSFGQ